MRSVIRSSARTILLTSVVGCCVFAVLSKDAWGQAGPGPTSKAHRLGKQPRSKVKPWNVGISPARRARALRLSRQGKVYFGQSVYSVAAALFGAALKDWDHPEIRFNLALCNLRQKKPVEAYLNLMKALRFGKEPLKDLYQEAVRRLNDLTGRLATLKVVCAEPGARVTLDGKLLFNGPGQARRVIKPGAHLVVATFGTTVNVVRSVVVRAAKTLSVVLRLRRPPLRRPEAPQPRRGSRYHWSVPASVSVIAGVVLSLGVGLLANGRSDVMGLNSAVHEHLEVYGPSVPYTYDAPRAERGRRQQIAGYALLGVAGAMAVTGVVLWLLRKKRLTRERSSGRPWIARAVTFRF